jgi:ADP-heptose:LPS heptosyltransferase
VCGISWRSKNAEFGADKSITLEALQPILSCTGVDFVDLQYGDTDEERGNLQQTHGIRVHHLDEIDNKDDIDGLAALISACDIVITISNVTAHIAGALGKPTIVMLPNSPSLFWYWHGGRVDSPWYPTNTLVTQSRSNEWSGVIEAATKTMIDFKFEFSK